MRERLINILKSASMPIMSGDVQVGEYNITNRMANHLADILIKNGVILSKCKVGDIVWVDDFMWGLIPCIVDEPYHCRMGEPGSCTFEMSFTEDDIGRMVYLTKEDAEKMRNFSGSYQNRDNTYYFKMRDCE